MSEWLHGPQLGRAERFEHFFKEKAKCRTGDLDEPRRGNTAGAEQMGKLDEAL